MVKGWDGFIEVPSLSLDVDKKEKKTFTHKKKISIFLMYAMIV